MTKALSRVQHAPAVVLDESPRIRDRLGLVCPLT